MSKRRYGRAGLCVFVILLMLGIFSANATAEMTTSFHGYLESNFVLRDINGVQYGFFDEAYGVQQRNTLKFDVDVNPGLELGPFRVEKVHLTFRGAYDSIFDLRAHAYDIKENLGASRFDYGLKDIRFESDLREAFIDFAYKGDFGDGFFRPGRQIVSWGEGSLETLLDVINPPDQSYQMFFQNPDDVKIPLWMARLNYSLPRLPGFGINFDLLWVPDIRPSQFAPRDSVAGNSAVGMQAPYSSIFFSGMKGMTVREDVPTNENEYGAKLSAEIGDRLDVSLVYFRDVVNDPGVLLKDFVLVGTRPIPTMALYTHNKQHVYGGYFSYQLFAFGMEAIIRGEISRYTAYPVSLASPVVNYAAMTAKTFTYKPVTKVMLAIDKDMRIKWFSPHDITKISVEWLHTVINEWDSSLSNPTSTMDRKNTREQDTIKLSISTYWWASKLAPSFSFSYNPGKHGEGGTGMVRPSIKWNITPQIYTEGVLQAFLGDREASYKFASFINTSEATLKLGYEW